MCIQYILLALLILLLMVLNHELSYYTIGRLLNFKITEFSVGFGKAIFQKTNKRGEKISLRLFPLGGYCAFAGEGDDDESDGNDQNSNLNINEKNSAVDKKNVDVKNNNQSKKQGESSKAKGELLFNEQPAWKRILVFLAGVTFNFVAGIIFSFILLCAVGYDIPQVTKYDPLAYSVSDNYVHNSSAEALKEGDVIFSINGRKIDFAYGSTFNDIITDEQRKLLAWVKDNENADFAEYPVLNFVVRRDGQLIEVPVSFYQIEQEKKDVDENGKEIIKTEKAYSLGIYAQAYKHSFWEALQRAIPFTFGLAWVVLKSLWLLITFQLGVEAIGGPITTIATIATVTQASTTNLLVLIPLISANLAVFNLLPIPALDGSHVLFTTIEWIRKKPINRRIENIIHTVGLAVLFGLVILVDILQFVL